MRPIKFRGFKKGGGGWVYGDLIHNGFDGKKFFVVGIKPYKNYPEEVYPESVGQYLDEIDSSGKEIYEGDIINGIAIEFHRVYSPQAQGYTYGLFLDDNCYDGKCKLFIQGNIFEHPHLLEKK